MVFPLPRVVPDAQPGGGIFNVFKNIMGSANELTRGQLENQFYPQTQSANNASKLAYANLMGPQFVSKLFNNPAILANMPDNQLKDALNLVVQSGTGKTSGQNYLNNLNNSNNQPNPLSSLLNQPNLSNADRNNIRGMQPGQSYVVQGNQSSMGQPMMNQGNPQQPMSMPHQQSSFSENVGNYQGTIKELEEAGKIRANDIKDLNNTVFNGETKQATLNDIGKILSSPEFEQIRQVPLAGRHELSYYSKFGTPEQQSMVGQYYTLTGNIIKDSARDFAGQFRRGEQQLLQSMKPSPSDTVDTARGKIESLSYMNKLLTERSRSTSQLMSKNHINKLEAQDIADKRIDGDKLRNEIHDKLYPNVQIKNKSTGEIRNVPISEARKLGAVPNV